MQFTILSTLTTLVALVTAQPTQINGRDTQGLHTEVTRAHSGKLTYYTPGMGSCGVVNNDNDMIVAVSSAMFGTYANPNASPMCQKTITIHCNGKKVVAAVKDRCAGCGTDDIDVSPKVFQKCAALAVGAMTVSWDLN